MFWKRSPFHFCYLSRNQHPAPRVKRAPGRGNPGPAARSNVTDSSQLAASPDLFACDVEKLQIIQSIQSHGHNGAYQQQLTLPGGLLRDPNKPQPRDTRQSGMVTPTSHISSAEIWGFSTCLSIVLQITAVSPSQFPHAVCCLTTQI